MRLLIADAFPETFLDGFRALGFEVDYRPQCKAEELPNLARDVSVLVVRSTKVTRAVIDAASKLALVIRAGAGFDNIDVEAASERGIYVSTCPGKNSAAVAELTMGLILAMDRRIPDGTTALREGQWNKKAFSKAAGLKGRTLGIAGMGPIGQAVARRALGFDMQVLAWSRSLTDERARELGVERAPGLLALAERADIVSVHLAQTPDTRKAFGAEFFDRMKPGAMFVNTSRGGLHDEAALARAMETKGLRVALDVYEKEPEGGTAAFTLPFARSERFVGTHHVGASTEEAQHAIAAECLRICAEFSRRGEPPNVVNVDRHAPADCQLIVRHYDKVGVLAAVLGIIRNHGLNVEEMSNTIFRGAKAAVAVLRVSGTPARELIDEIAALEGQVIQVEAKPVAT